MFVRTAERSVPIFPVTGSTSLISRRVCSAPLASGTSKLRCPCHRFFFSELGSSLFRRWAPIHAIVAGAVGCSVSHVKSPSG